MESHVQHGTFPPIECVTGVLTRVGFDVIADVEFVLSEEGQALSEVYPELV